MYEYMPNGSLDKYLFKKITERNDLTWPQRFSISCDMARGLAYLHEGCRKRIIHCDIKPENILLDEKFSAKLSDFGLAKLIDRQEPDTFTVVRGTRGYLAPEWFVSNTPITEKCDVYSYGMVLLELIGGRKNVDFKVSSAKCFFHVWVYDKVVSSDLSEIVDKHLSEDVDVEQVLLVAKVALACVQEDPGQRPTMSKVFLLLLLLLLLLTLVKVGLTWHEIISFSFVEIFWELSIWLFRIQFNSVKQASCLNIDYFLRIKKYRLHVSNNTWNLSYVKYHITVPTSL